MYEGTWRDGLDAEGTNEKVEVSFESFESKKGNRELELTADNSPLPAKSTRYSDMHESTMRRENLHHTKTKVSFFLRDFRTRRERKGTKKLTSTQPSSPTPEARASVDDPSCRPCSTQIHEVSSFVSRLKRRWRRERELLT